MKKIVVITASRRVNGNSRRMADSFIKAAEAQGCQVTRFDAAGMKVEGCLACGRCFSAGKACAAVDDDFNKVADAIIAADGIVLVTPVYWYTFPAKIKLIIDKFYSFCVAKKDFSGKKCALIACCEDEPPETFDGIRFSYEHTMQLLNCESVDEILIPGVNKLGAIGDTDGEKRAAELAARMFDQD